VLQCAAVCCSVLQCVAVCCSVLQCVAVCCSVLQYSQPKSIHWIIKDLESVIERLYHVVLQCVAVCCSVLQRVAVCCSVLQCVAQCCSVLQYSQPKSIHLIIKDLESVIESSRELLIVKVFRVFRV